ncbi:MAG: hypothetical protein WAO55_07615 [Candidatus Manganitrophaceae bacterium]
MKISSEETATRLQAWADVTLCAIELRLALLRKRHPDTPEKRLRSIMREEIFKLKFGPDE